MNELVKHQDLSDRDDLFAIGRACTQMKVGAFDEGDLDDATYLVQTHDEDGLWERTARVSLRPEALAGFGALVGVRKQLNQLFPLGTDFLLRTWQDNSTKITIGEENVDVVTVGALASGMKSRKNDGLWVLTLETNPAVLEDPALSAIQDPKILVCAASYALQLTQRVA